jgi:hypothetical protein
MGSQLDLDQGGTVRQNFRLYLGPSIGWIDAPMTSILKVLVGGTTQVLTGTTFVVVLVNALVTLQLPLAKGNAAGAGAVPGTYPATQLIIVDGLGIANNHNITVLPAGTEAIDGFTAAQGGVTISSNFGALILQPDVANGGWVLSQ